MNTEGSFTGVFDLNTNPVEYFADSKRIDQQILFTTETTSELLQKYFFTESTPDEVIKKYQKLVGMPAVPPEWAFGWGAYQEGL